jgi:RHS repeat-associated protein
LLSRWLSFGSSILAQFLNLVDNSYSYNANGEQTNRTLAGTSHTLAWDYDGQLLSSTVGGVATTFTYDALGRRLTRASGGTTTQFLSTGDAGDYQVWLEAVGSTVTSQYSYGNALVRKDSEYPLYDGLGSERTVTNGSQTVTGTLNLDAFGQLAGSTGSSTNPYMYAATSGYRNDGDAGLTHVRARYYDAQVGRFISRDSVLMEHPYVYCGHQPVTHLDPDGHEIKIVIDTPGGRTTITAPDTAHVTIDPASGKITIQPYKPAGSEKGPAAEGEKKKADAKSRWDVWVSRAKEAATLYKLLADLLKKDSK